MFARIAGCGILVCLAVVGFAPAADRAERELPKELQPRRATIQKRKITLANALQALAEQTEIKVDKPADEDPELNLEINNLTFWEALDAIARKADLRINLHTGAETIALVKGPYREVPTSYDGLFRVSVKQIIVARDLEQDGTACTVRLEVAWEPRFRGFLLELGPEGLTVKDQRGLGVETPSGRGQVSIDQRRSTTVDLFLPAFKRSDARIGELKGSFSVIGSGKMETFTFDKLAKGEKKTQGGVTVELTNFKTDEELWFLDCAIRYPADGPKFESFQSWLVGNEAYLTEKKGNRKLNNAGYESGDREGTSAFVTYQFTEDEQAKIALGKPADWRFVYRTPSSINQVPVRFQFKDIPLP